MSYLYKCRICGTNEVEHPGDICEVCAIGVDPYAQALSGNSSSTDDYRQPQISTAPVRRGNSRKVLISRDSSNVPANRDSREVDMYDDDSSSDVQVYQPGQMPANNYSQPAVAPAAAVKSAPKSGMLTEGIVKNLSVDKQEASVIVKLFRSLFSGIPFTMDDTVTMFQVFPDYSGTSLNAQGNACDQVIMYGKITSGSIAENNDVEVYGRRDSSNNIVASRVVNRASGTTVIPSGAISSVAVWAIVSLIFAAAAGLFSSVGGTGILWIIVAIICFTNLPLVWKIISGIIAMILSMFGIR